MGLPQVGLNGPVLEFRTDPPLGVSESPHLMDQWDFIHLALNRSGGSSLKGGDTSIRTVAPPPRAAPSPQGPALTLPLFPPKPRPLLAPLRPLIPVARPLTAGKKWEGIAMAPCPFPPVPTPLALCRPTRNGEPV